MTVEDQWNVFQDVKRRVIRCQKSEISPELQTKNPEINNQ